MLSALSLSLLSALPARSQELDLSYHHPVLEDYFAPVSATPATPDAAHLASAALPRLEAALAAHAPAFHHVAVVLATSKKGKSDEIA